MGKEAGGYDFAVDSGIMNDIKTRLLEDKKKLKEKRREIYSELKNLNDAWSGSSYDTFYNKCASYKDSMKMLETILKAYSKICGDIAMSAAYMNDSIDQALKGNWAVSLEDE